MDNFYAAMLVGSPNEVKAKRKFHLLAHLAASVQQYGPAKNFATERYESFNSVARNASMCSNRAAPSRDIALRMYGQNLIRQHMADVRPDRNGNVSEIANFATAFRDGELLSLYGMEVRKKSLVPGSWQRDAQAAAVVITQRHGNAARRLFPDAYVALGQGTYDCLRSCVTAGKERIYVGSFAIVSNAIAPEAEEVNLQNTKIVKVIAIFGCPRGLPNIAPATAGEPLAVVKPFFWKDRDRSIISLVQGTSETLIPVSAIRHVCNVAHHCAHHQCQVAASGFRRQEREQVEARVNVVEHSEQTTPLLAIMNDALCRSGWAMSEIYGPVVQMRTPRDVLNLMDLAP
ncbi:hypothetical protein CF319_g9071 [Tilletia indica]|nr:hypothetical protein CF319_g9071 [Tilletia indica]